LRTITSQNLSDGKISRDMHAPSRG
jgi:hypothetical protein